MIDNTEQVIEEEVPVEQPEAPVSLRDTLVQVTADVKAKDEPEVTEKKIRAKDNTGKFVKEDKLKAPTKVAAQPEVKAEPEIKIPKSFGTGVQAKWKELPREIQQELSKREDDVHKALAAQDEDRIFGKQVRETAHPYMALIRAERGDVNRAWTEFLNTAYLLRTESPQKKGQLIMQLAQEFGADLRGATQAQAPVDPRFNQVLQEVQSLKSTLQQQQEFKKQTEDNELKRQIDTFAADPEHSHFETVKAHMAALLKGGIAKDLQDAYEQAVYANPQTRSTLLEQQHTQAQEKRVAEQKARADAARKAGSSIKGSPGMGAVRNGKISQPDLRSELKAQFAAFRDG